MFILLDIILNILIEHKLFVQNIYPAYQRQPVRNLVSPANYFPLFNYATGCLFQPWLWPSYGKLNYGHVLGNFSPFFYSDEKCKSNFRATINICMFPVRWKLLTFNLTRHPMPSSPQTGNRRPFRTGKHWRKRRMECIGAGQIIVQKLPLKLWVFKHFTTEFSP